MSTQKVNNPNPRPPLAISSEEEFNALMEDIDKEMASEGVNIPVRPLMAGIKMSGRYDIVLNAFPGEHPILPGIFTADQISLKIHDWMKKRYGDRLKLQNNLGRVVIPLRGAIYAIRCPSILGRVRFICDPSTFGLPRKAIGVRAIPVCNVLDLIEGLTSDFARSLTPEEGLRISIAHASAMGAYSALHSVSDVPFVSEAIGDIGAAVNHLLEGKPQTGLSKWASLQAVEKLLKAFILGKGGKVQRHHAIKNHAADAAKLGFPVVPEEYVKNLECPASARYGEIAVSVEEAGIAHLTSLDVCEVAAQLIGKNLQRTMPETSQLRVDGMSVAEFMKKHPANGQAS